MKIKTTKQIIFETEEEIKLIEACLAYTKHRMRKHGKQIVNLNMLEQIQRTVFWDKLKK